MKNFIIITIFLFTLNCSLNKVTNTHGFKFIKKNYDKILINKSNKNDVRKIIGPPSSKSDFDDMWFYIERKKTNQSIIKIGKKKIEENNIIIVQFNNIGLVIDKRLLDINNMNDLKRAEKKTKKKFRQDNLLYDLLTTLREKINAPTRR